ncbi:MULTISPECIES: metal-dependent transcriptional regulator [unclassified Rothia (in: high G+C Gram-positive bacteria)]|uniref:metal-dependent transcriptional regulator n=1 Tax=unclassified Rothia (in: high G+C Gram-positive bacteria) TaxID=2689056 RepID=UPI001956EFAE|nr:metal-dependent transcriptional regulator [Rothia sp. ZJ932]MBM7052029.1 metal-dependent transcriptional regulator [Rothia sp. ZJ1223]QRZ61913.1 metal-dependent transcriptional regulator [Rothia sp. ZJ932]
MADLIDTTEMYLRTILELEEEGITPMRARIAERLEHSGPTVSQTVARMERHGLVEVAENRSLQLTDEGRRKAVEVMRKHRLAERLLADVIGLDLEYIHDEACRWEHVMSERVERRLLELLDNPKFSPYGNAIPGLEELGDVSEVNDSRTVSMAIAAKDSSESDLFVVSRLPEFVQTDIDLLGKLTDAGIVYGAKVSVVSTGQGIRVKAVGHDDALTLSHEIADAIVVKRS